MSINAGRRASFFFLVTTQFLSSLGDNALLIVAIALLTERGASSWMAPALRIVFYVAYLLLAPFAGALADRYRKNRVLFATGLVKLFGCGLLVVQVHPLLAYTLIGLGAAAYMPAKYGSLPELLTGDELVAGNAWIEVTNVISVLLGVALGSWLLSRNGVDTLGFVTSPTRFALCGLAVIYALAAAFALRIGSPSAPQSNSGWRSRPLVRFCNAQRLLWHDREGSLSLAVTSLFWAIAAVLQFLVMRWSQSHFNLSLAQASLLQLPVALGMVGGALVAARLIRLHEVARLLPIGVAMGFVVVLVAFVDQLWLAVLLLGIVGAMGGTLLVPMNAMFQHRGQKILSTGESVAVQNFNEHFAAVVLLCGFAFMEYCAVPLQVTIVGMGGLVVATMASLAFMNYRCQGKCGGHSGKGVLVKRRIDPALKNW